MPGNFKKDLLNGMLENTMEEIMCLDSDDDDDIDEIMENLETNLEVIKSFRFGIQRNVPRNDSWFIETLANYDDDRFKRMLRVSKQQFNIILELIKDHEGFRGKRSCLQHTLFFQLSLVLYRLGASGEGASIARIASLFGVGDGATVNRITRRVLMAILSLKKLFLSWPNSNERNNIVSSNMGELPYCIGYVDGTEIPLDEAPNLDPTSYFSRKKSYSIKLQGICDPNLKLRHICVGYPGSVHDAKIFANSSIGRNVDSYFSNEQWIAGDSAYKLTKFVITPYRNSRISTSNKKIEFNKLFSKYRVRIEHCFGFLKEKFNSLKRLKVNIQDPDTHRYACLWITVCCIIYNIILPYWEPEDLELFFEVCDEDNEEIDDNDDDDNGFEADLLRNKAAVGKLGEYKREALVSIILNGNNLNVS